MSKGRGEKLVHAGRILFVAVFCISLSSDSYANPAGGSIQVGEIRFEQQGNSLLVIQGSDRGIIDWDSFSIANGETTRFLQPGSSSATLNRVTGETLSRIDGRLLANGRVFLLNSNGIIVGREGQIDVAGFVASTLDIDNNEFLAGGDLSLKGASQAAVINLGSISAFDGDVFLVAATVDNSGFLRAPKGTVGLAAGNDVLIKESGAERIYVRGASGGQKEEGVVNRGTIEANVAELKSYGGNLYGMAVKNEGRVAATAVTREGGQIFLRAGGRSPGKKATGGGRIQSTGTLTVSRPVDGNGGNIVIDAGPEGKTEVGGTLNVRGRGGKGGEVILLGDTVEVFEGALILADGDSGGGTVKIGGGLQGGDAELDNSSSVTIGSGAQISADALISGDGGTVIVFAEGTLHFRGQASVNGGVFGGNGGFVELSGKQSLFVDDLVGQVDLTSAQGLAGTLLLDPVDLSVISGVSGGVAGTTITDGAINDFLTSSGSLIITTSTGTGGSGDITVAGDAAITWANSSELRFFADRDFIMSGGASIASTGTGDFVVEALRLIQLGSSSQITTGAGDISLTANTLGNTSGNFSGITLEGATLSATSGNISLLGQGGSDALTGGHSGIQILGGSVVSTTSGNILVAGTGVSGTYDNFGVSISQTDTVVSSGSGTITITGNGAAGATEENNDGIGIDGGARIESVSGDLTLTGVAGGGTAGRNGVAIYGTGTSVTSTDGLVKIDGTGGASSLLSNVGVFLSLSGGVHSETNDVIIDGVGGQGGIFVLGGASVTAAGGDLSLYGKSLSASYAGIKIDVSTITAGSGTIHLKGEGGVGSNPIAILGSSDSSTIGSGTETIILDSLLGSVTILNLISSNQLQFRDSTGAESVAFIAANLSNSVSEISALGNGSNGRIGSLDFRNSGGFLVGSFLGGSGIDATGGIKLLSSIGSFAPIRIEQSVTSQGGDIDLDGTDIVVTGASLTTTGAGTILLDSYRSILIEDGSVLSVINGNLGLTANTDGLAYGDFNGIWIDASSLSSSGSGNITLKGTGGEYAYTAADGIRVTGGSTIDSTDSGLITLIGKGGNNGSAQAGVHLSGALTRIASVSGAISITGTGGTSYNGSGRGVVVDEGALVDSTGPGTGAATIEIQGTGGGAGSENFGVLVEGADTQIRSVSGDVTVIGTGGGDGFGSGNKGIVIRDSDLALESSGTGATGAMITLDGTGGNGVDDNLGVDIRNANLATSGGNFEVSGDGGAAATGARNRGVLLHSSTLSTGGSGTFVVLGNGGGGDDQNDGIQMEVGASVRVNNGALTMTGVAGGTLGIGVISTNNSGDILSLGTGSVSIAGTGVNARGMSLSHLNTGGSGAGFVSLVSNNGDLYVESVVTASGDLTVSSGKRTEIGGILSSSIGNITLTGDDVTVNAGVNATVGDILIQIGTVAASGGGTAAINALLSHGGSLRFVGGAGASDMVTYAGFAGGPVQFELDDLSNIEFLVGSGSTMDEITGSALATTYLFTGANQFAAEGVAVSAFENLTAGDDEDVFSFNAGGSLSGHLDGGGGVSNEINYAGFLTGAVLDLQLAVSSGVEAGFSNIHVFGGSPNLDTVRGLTTASTYTFDGPSRVSVAGFEVNGFENLIAGSGADSFLVLSGGGIGGVLNGGGGYDRLDYSAYGSPVSVNVGNGNATGFGGVSGVEKFVGSLFSDTLSGGSGSDTFSITAVHAGNVNTGFDFASFERLIGGAGNDRFLFSNQATVESFDGGSGFDFFQLDDRNLGGINTYTVTSNSVSRNPFYSFSGIERIELLLGSGDDTVNSGSTGFEQFYDGGSGFDILNLGPGISLSGSPMAVGNSSVYHVNFEAPFPNGGDEQLTIQTSNVPRIENLGNSGFQVTDQFSSTAVQTLFQSRGAFSAIASSIVGQAVVIQIDGQQYLLGPPMSLDGTFGVPPAELINQLRRNLEPNVWIELAEAIDFDGSMILVYADGSWAIDLRGNAPVDIAAILTANLDLEAASELWAALEMDLVLSISPAEGPIAILAVPIVIDVETLALLADLLNDASFTELTAALEIP